MPRSWHSSTSYFSFIPTVWPQMSQTSPRAWFVDAAARAEHLVVAVADRRSASRRSSCRACAGGAGPASLPHLHSQLPIEYSMNSSDEFSRKSLIGKTDLNTDCRPASSRSEGSRFICRNRSYDFRWISIRFGIGTVVLIFEKSLRSR